MVSTDFKISYFKEQLYTCNRCLFH